MLCIPNETKCKGVMLGGKILNTAVCSIGVCQEWHLVGCKTSYWKKRLAAFNGQSSDVSDHNIKSGGCLHELFCEMHLPCMSIQLQLMR